MCLQTPSLFAALSLSELDLGGFAMIAVLKIHRGTCRELLCGAPKLSRKALHCPFMYSVPSCMDNQTHSTGADVVALVSAETSTQGTEFIQRRVSI